MRSDCSRGEGSSVPLLKELLRDLSPSEGRSLFVIWVENFALIILSLTPSIVPSTCLAFLVTVQFLPVRSWITAAPADHPKEGRS